MGAVSDLIDFGALVLNPAHAVTGTMLRQVTSHFVSKPDDTTKVKVITATGTGTSREAALINAKVRALEKVSGVFVSSTTITTDTSQNTRTGEYYGGVVKDYEVLDEEQARGIFSVTITATIVGGKNNIVKDETSVPVMIDKLNQLQDLQGRQQQFVRTFEDQPTYALSNVTMGYFVRGNMVEFSVKYHLAWSPKMVDDIKTYSRLAGKKVDIGDQRSMYAVCFGTVALKVPEDDCYDLAASIPQLEASARIQVVVSYKGNQHSETYDVPLDRQQNAFRLVTYPGSKVYHPSSGKEVRYARGLVMFEQGSADGNTMIRIPISQATEISNVQVAITTSEGQHANNSLQSQRSEY